MYNYCLYWYHFEEHTNPSTEGYIGITNDIQRRHNEHMRYIKNGVFNHFYNAVRKYSDKQLIKTILYNNISRDEAKLLEEEYRPTTNIGWNSSSGGILPAYVNKHAVSLVHQDDINNIISFNSTTEASNELGISRARISQALIRKTNSFGLDGWHVINENTNLNTILTYSEMRSKALKGKPKSKPSRFKGVTNRWTKEQKSKIGSYHKGKIISEEQKEIVRNKNRKNSPLCCKIIIKHKDNDTIYEFHSISEASRQLNIPLSRLKSKALRPLGVYGNDGWAIMSKDK